MANPNGIDLETDKLVYVLVLRSCLLAQVTCYIYGDIFLESTGIKQFVGLATLLDKSEK